MRYHKCEFCIEIDLPVELYILDLGRHLCIHGFVWIQHWYYVLFKNMLIEEDL